MEANVFSLREFHGYSPNLGFQATNFRSNIGLFRPSKNSLFRPRSDCLKLDIRLNSRGSISNSVSQAEPFGFSTVDGAKDNVNSVSPGYVPTPLNRDLRTPHSGYCLIVKEEKMLLF